MLTWYSAVILGIVEGLTEYLPISSTGHLILTGSLLDLSGPKQASFDIIIQLGAILAVVVIYRDRFMGLIRPDSQRSFSGIRGLWLLFLTSLPASLLGLLVHKAIKQYLFGPTTVALALGVGAILIFIVEALPKKVRFTGLDEMTPKLALGIGFFQCLSLWPGFSRSASTIMGAMILGADRRLAAEYSFVAAVPIMIAATGFDFVKNHNVFSADDLVLLGIGFVVSFLFAWLAVKWFIRLVQNVSLRPFAWYRIVLAVAVVLFWPA
ncbi:undecaprenyl-diphosphate phosphatase [Desulfovibrio inopinatus]|uniref:undecaprenyl-diphosphate phosphatase n=1 Tax=Desulfovibrio inopinatus TaxID=102109 RepID=UPI000420C9C8|nr:undecaprenyl-diphosphate phosphatase [Desulfovibrio inopinatus]